MSDLSIGIESNYENKDNNKPHNGNPITMLEISPNGNYIVTYSYEDKSIVGWNVKNTDEEKLKPDHVYRNHYLRYGVNQIYVSDNKKLAYIDKNYKLKIIDMSNNNQKIKPYFNKDIDPTYCTFNLKNEFILYSKNIIWIYSTKTTKNNEWNCKKIYDIPADGFNLISISKYNKLYLFSIYDYCIYEWDILTEKCIRLFDNDEIKKHIEHYKLLRKLSDIRISSNGKFICLKIKDKIIIYSIELEIPIISLDINNNDTLPYNFMNYIDPDLYSLLLTLFNTKLFDDEQTQSIGIWNPIMEYYCKEYLPKEYQTENLLIPPFLFDNTTKFVYRILDGYVWKIKIEKVFKIRNELEEGISEIIENSDELNNENDIDIIKSWDIYLDMDNEYDDHVNDPYVEQKLTHDLKLKANIDGEKIQLQAFKKNNVNDEWDLICTSEHDTKTIEKYRILGIKLYNDNDIIILTTIGIFIYNFNESNKSISLNLFYHIILNQYHEEKIKKELRDYRKIVSSKPSRCLQLYPENDYKYDRDHNERVLSWVSSAKDNKLSFLKYGVELLLFAIKEHKLELIDDIYKECINYFKQDLENNRMLLSIIISTMLTLNEYYPEYILRYSLETTMIIDFPYYSIEYKNNNLHLYSFSQYPKIVDLSILWTKYAYISYYNNGIMFQILKCIQILIILLTFPIYFPTFYILSKSHFVNDIYDDTFSYIYFYIFDKISSKFSKYTTTPTITFMIPYIKFVNYSQDYNWFLDFIRPQSSPFVKTISRDIYKTWSGEALINFKWNTYGKYYYAIIWIIFMALFGCFSTAATVITLAEDIRNKLLIASIILGFIHLLTEIRQIIYDPKKWIRDLWNMLDIIAYLFPICTSIYWLKTNNMNDQIIWSLSFSCLFLDIKFLMFFRVFESFGVYFAIIISVGKQIISFLVVLLIIIMSFAHAFYILLLPRSDNDPNSPLNLATTYNRVLGDGTIDPNPSLIQPPDDNTNMFVDYGTSILAMYLFLTGDSSSLTNWSYIKNPSLVLLIVLFSFLVVVYLMNLFIGLLNIAIEQDNNRVSYLIEKAKILAEIELFYLLPNQRRWQAWFPDTIHYYANADETRDKIKEMINNGEWNTDEFPELKEKLLNKLNLKHNHDKLMKIIEEIATRL